MLASQSDAVSEALPELKLRRQRLSNPSLEEDIARSEGAPTGSEDASYARVDSVLRRRIDTTGRRPIVMPSYRATRVAEALLCDRWKEAVKGQSKWRREPVP